MGRVNIVKCTDMDLSRRDAYHTRLLLGDGASTGPNAEGEHSMGAGEPMGAASVARGVASSKGAGG